MVAYHLTRFSFSLAVSRQGFDYLNHLFFWKDDDDKEVDFVLHHKNEFEAPMEVKYRSKVDHRELGGLASFLDKTGVKSGLVLSRDELEERYDYLLIPASLFLMLV